MILRIEEFCISEKKKKKLTGKEQAMLNKRKKFYEKFERICLRMSKKPVTERLIILSMNKGISFPEYDELSKIFEDSSEILESDREVEKIKQLELVYYEEAHFILKMSEQKYVGIFRKETNVDNEGNELRGVSRLDESYNYQSSYNWVIKIEEPKKLLEILTIEKENPSEYDLTPEKAVIPEPFYRKSYRVPRRRKR